MYDFEGERKKELTFSRWDSGSGLYLCLIHLNEVGNEANQILVSRIFCQNAQAPKCVESSTD